MRHTLIAMCMGIVTLGWLSPANAQVIHPNNKSVDSGDFPDSFFGHAAVWYTMNNKNKLAIDVLVAQFAEIPKAWVTLSDSPLRPADVQGFINECSGAYRVIGECLGGLVFAIVESEGRYAVAPGAPKQSGEAQADTLRRAKRVRAVLMRSWSQDIDSPSYNHITRTAISVELRRRNYPEAMRLFRSEFPSSAAIGSLEGKAVAAALEKLPEEERIVVMMGISAVLASAGAVDWDGKAVKDRARQRATITRAIQLYKDSGVKDIAIEASILESDPAKRNEYYNFVHKAAVEGKFTNVIGWRHAALMYEELAAVANNGVANSDSLALPPKPVVDDQSCGD